MSMPMGSDLASKFNVTLFYNSLLLQKIRQMFGC